MLYIHEPGTAGNKNRQKICRWTEALKLAQKGDPVFPCINRPGHDDDKKPLTPRSILKSFTIGGCAAPTL